jgi:hypothetical protein
MRGTSAQMKRCFALMIIVICSSIRSAYSKQSVGQFCEEDGDCASWTCRENTCFASSECKTLKHTPNDEFDENMIVLVFVGSGFNDIISWRKQVARTYYAFQNFEFFDYSNTLYNAFYVESLEADSFCDFNCAGIDRLLCCDVKKTRELTSKCLPPGVNVNTVVIENSEKYGGAGYQNENIATTSIHESGPKVAIHELGHSLFELGDEYIGSSFTAESGPNCDVDGCAKWADLDEHLGGGLCEQKGCQNGDYFVPGSTFMNAIDQPFGEVNTRYTCCTFLALTKSLPSYCNRFEFGEGLTKFCKNDYQGYGLPYGQVDFKSELNATVGKYVLISHPATLILNTTEETFSYESSMQGEGPKTFLRRKYFGDFESLRSVIDHGLSSVKQVSMEFDTGHEVFLYYRPSDTVEMPPNNENMVEFIEVDLELLEVVVDYRHGIVIGVEFEVRHEYFCFLHHFHNTEFISKTFLRCLYNLKLQDVEITWWVILKVWFQELWEGIKTFLIGLFSNSDKDSLNDTGDLIQ